MKRAAALAFVATLAMSPSARAWDSKCDAACMAAGGEGPATAQHRMTDEVNHADEHRRIFLEALALARGPAEVDFTLSTFTASPSSFAAISFLTAGAIVKRVHAPSEFSQLPDFSYSLWDWALGNETCPVPNLFVTGSYCHSFIGHMGATNANHFLPQTKKNYERYHALAMDRARECATLKDKVAARPELQRFFQACESEALVLEAVGHHFLGDSWSAGHTWQRWGSPNEGDFPLGAAQALAVGSIAGLVHGGKAVLQDQLPAGSDANDPMNAPSPEVLVSSPSGPIPMLGDIYLPTLRQSSTTQYSAQYNGMYGCMVGSLRAVLTAAGETLGTAGVAPRDPSTDPSCFGLRATNQALRAGFGIDFTTPSGTQISLPLDLLAAGLVVLAPGVSTAVPELTVPLEFDLIRIGTTLSIRKAQDPLAIDQAEGGMGPMLGILPNGQFDRLGSYIDPALPWPSASSPTSQELALLRAFHESHAREWCNLFKAGDPENDLDKLRARASSATGAARDAACEVCTEFAERHLRVGDEATYVPTPAEEPLCGLIADQPGAVQYVYAPAQRGAAVPRRQLAKSYCGCNPLEASVGTFHHEVTGAFQTALLVRIRTAGNVVPPVDVPFSLEGPPGYNGGQPVSLTYPHGWIRQFFTAAPTPVSGTYTVRATIDGQPYAVTTNVDATQILPAALNITPDLTVANQIGGTWTAASGAGSYLLRVFDTAVPRILTPVLFTTSTTGQLTGVPVNGANQNALQVWTFSNDMRPPDPPMPAQFNLSFNRTLLTGTVTVSGGANVAPSSNNNVTATVTGLAGTSVTWRTSGGSIAPNGNSATWTAPAQTGTYTVTATSVDNPSFRASTAFHVVGGSACTAAQVPGMFAGDWRVIDAVDVPFGAIYNDCSKIGAVYAFEQGGAFNMGTGGTMTIANAQPISGNYACPPSFAAGGAETSIGLGTQQNPDDYDAMTGQVTIRVGKFLPCVVQFTAVRSQ